MVSSGVQPVTMGVTALAVLMTLSFPATAEQAHGRSYTFAHGRSYILTHGRHDAGHSEAGKKVADVDQQKIEPRPLGEGVGSWRWLGSD